VQSKHGGGDDLHSNRGIDSELTRKNLGGQQRQSYDPCHQSLCERQACGEQLQRISKRQSQLNQEYLFTGGERMGLDRKDIVRIAKGSAAGSPLLRLPTIFLDVPIRSKLEDELFVRIGSWEVRSREQSPSSVPLPAVDVVCQLDDESSARARGFAGSWIIPTGEEIERLVIRMAGKIQVWFWQNPDRKYFCFARIVFF
jgi:hypothetical protein